MNREILYRSDYFRGKGKIKKNPLSNPFGACKQQYRVSLAYSSFAQRNPDEILLISGFKRGEKRGRGKKKNTCKISPQSNRFRDSNIYIYLCIFLDGIARLRGFDFSPVPFKTQRNENATGKSFPLLFLLRICTRIRICVRVCVCVVRTFLMVPAFIFIFPFVSNVSRYIRMSSVAQLGFSFTFWSRHRPDFPPFSPLPLPLFPRVCINFFFFFQKKKKRIVVHPRSTKHLLSIRVHGRSNPARSVVKRNRLEKYRGWRDIDIGRINSRRSQFPRDRVDLSSRIKEGGLYLFFWSNQKLRGVIRSCIFQGTLTDESKGNISSLGRTVLFRLSHPSCSLSTRHSSLHPSIIRLQIFFSTLRDE